MSPSSPTPAQPYPLVWGGAQSWALLAGSVGPAEVPADVDLEARQSSRRSFVAAAPKRAGAAETYVAVVVEQ